MSIIAIIDSLCLSTQIAKIDFRRSILQSESVFVYLIRIAIVDFRNSLIAIVGFRKSILGPRTPILDFGRLRLPREKTVFGQSESTNSPILDFEGPKN